jgi:DNA segregation ATPase FtsK/SpoIIIE-like protein
VELDWTSAAHVVIQGATRSGKTTGLYSVLAQLAKTPDVEVTGCDPTGLLLGPWAARRGLVASSVGTANPAAHVATLEALTATMDARIAGIPSGRDTVAIGPRCPLLVVVLEEYPGLLRVLDADRQLGKLARAAVARLLGEGAKAGLRVVLVAQRAEASIIGGYERGQASHALSFRVAGRDTVAMLHADAAADVVAAHATAPAGVALLFAPGTPLRRLRAPHVTYAEYVAAVAEGRAA